MEGETVMGAMTGRNTSCFGREGVARRHAGRIALQGILAGALMTMLIAVSGIAVHAAGGFITEIEFEEVSPGTERVLFHMNGFYPPEIFGLEGDNTRVVCDFYGTEIANTIERIMETGGDLITRIRVGCHVAPKRKTRVVLQLAPRGDFDVNQRFFSRERILAVSVTGR